MASVIETVETQLVTLVSTIPYFATEVGGSVRGVTDIHTFLELSTVPSPSAIAMFDGEKADDNVTIGHSTQKTSMHWSIFLIASSFSAASEGRIGSVGTYQMLDDVVSAVEGQLVALPNENTKFMYLGAEFFGVNKTQVVYRSRWRNEYIRTGL